MTAPEADLTGWACEPFSAAGFTHDVYRKGAGPGVVNLVAGQRLSVGGGRVGSTNHQHRTDHPDDPKGVSLQ